MTITLYWGSGSIPCRRVQIVLEEKAIAYQSRLLDFDKGEHKSPEMLALNPRGLLPVLEYDEHVICESLGSMLFLESQHPAPPLLPQQAGALALAYQRLAEVSNLIPLIAEPFYLKLFGQAETKEGQQQFAAMLSKIKADLQRWEAHMEGSEFAAGSAFGLADATLGPALTMLWWLGADLDAYPALAAYRERMEVYVLEWFKDRQYLESHTLCQSLMMGVHAQLLHKERPSFKASYPPSFNDPRVDWMSALHQ